MNDQPVFPSNSSGPFASPASGGSSGGGIVKFALIGVLALGAIGFAMLTLVFYNKAGVATKTLDDQKAKAAAAAREDQKKTDDLANTQANESPYRSFTAPGADGAFVIQFPKNWSSYADLESSGTQVLLILNPNSVGKTNGTDNLAAARITLQERTGESFMSQFQGDLKSGRLKQKAFTVGGLPGFDITGKFNDHRTSREVVIPVRDKVLVFVNENGSFGTEFGQILAQAKINP